MTEGLCEATRYVYRALSYESFQFRNNVSGKCCDVVVDVLSGGLRSQNLHLVSDSYFETNYILNDQISNR
jgi:hypothetical protein